MAEKKGKGTRREEKVEIYAPPPRTDGFPPRTQAILFLVALLLVAGFLYGLYQPFLRHLASQSMERSEAWMARARQVKQDTVHAYPIYDELEDRISGVISFGAIEEQYDLAVRDCLIREQSPAEERKSRVQMENAIQALRMAQEEAAPRYAKLFEFATASFVGAHLEDSFPEILPKLKLRQGQIEDFFEMVGNTKELGTIEARNSLGIIATRGPETLILFRRIRDLFDERASYDQALRELTVARGYARTWPKARRALADFYHERGFHTFGLEEDLVVLRLDPRGSIGQASRARLAGAPAEKWPEAHYRLGIAHLLEGDYAEAERSFREFVGTDPGSPFVVKAWELIEACAREDKKALQSFVEDEIWI